MNESTKQLEEQVAFLRQINGARDEILRIDRLLNRSDWEIEREDRKYCYIDLSQVDYSAPYEHREVSRAAWYETQAEHDYKHHEEHKPWYLNDESSDAFDCDQSRTRGRVYDDEHIDQEEEYCQECNRKVGLCICCDTCHQHPCQCCTSKVGS